MCFLGLDLSGDSMSLLKSKVMLMRKMPILKSSTRFSSMTEDGRVAGNVFAEGPGDPLRGGLGGAGAEELDVGESDSGDAAILRAVGGTGELEDDIGAVAIEG
ncbi:hypothetical protein SASPL_115127 [Salvia splendens]|uniref:Uncharacterized protein n=1 Tax=Salvia splendens TaxID=180675 RepID=A0A8X9A104_SALSN|nr:hypothetical protein SASPL_115127 [Salvia splendens]